MEKYSNFMSKIYLTSKKSKNSKYLLQNHPQISPNHKMTSFNRNCLEENNNNRLTLMKIDCYLQISVIVEAKSCHYSHFPCGYPNMAIFHKK